MLRIQIHNTDNKLRKIRQRQRKRKGIRIDEGKRVKGEKKIKRRMEESRQYGWRLMLL
jgi:hypothetical protein